MTLMEWTRELAALTRVEHDGLLREESLAYEDTDLSEPAD